MNKVDVSTGDIWRVGPHLFACGDLKDDAAGRLIDYAGVAPGLFFADLPWSSSVASAFRRQAGAGAYPFKDLLAATMLVVKRTTGCAFIEVSAKIDVREAIEEAIAAAGLSVLDVWTTKWNALEGTLYRVQGPDHPHPSLPPGTLTPTSGVGRNWVADEVVRSCLPPGGVVIDPVMGLGAVSLAAAQFHRVALGSELNPARVARNIERIAAVVKDAPTKVGRLPQ